MLLLYINDIDTNIASSIHLFADDCVLYRVIKSPQDHLSLQQDLNQLTGPMGRYLADEAKHWEMCRNDLYQVIYFYSYRPLLH